MFRHTNAFSGFSVDDLEKAKQFYGEVLDLDVSTGPMGILDLQIGDSTHIMIYPKSDHQPATFTILNFQVDQIEQTVDELTQRGVVFEQYDTEEIKTDEKGIFRDQGPTIAWFRDPAGNILSIIQADASDQPK